MLPLRRTRQRLLALVLTGLTGLTGLMAGPLPLRAEVPGSGLIWRVRERGGTVWLAGSLHQLPEAARLPPTYERAFEQAERLVMEIDLDDLDPGAMAAALMGRALLPPDRSLRTLLGPQRWARLQPHLAALGMPVLLVERLRPWAVALLLSSAGLARGGASPANGVENQLLRRAVADRKPVEGLETVAFQLALFDGLSEADQLQMLDLSLADFDVLPAQLQAIEHAWRQGDPKALEALVDRLEALAVVERLRPWAVALLLSSAGLARGGASPASGVENQLLRQALAERKPVEGLETLAFQLALFDGLSEADQLQMLDRSLADFDALPAQLQAIEHAWRQGDPKALEAVLQRLAPERSQVLQQRFVTRRNAAWLPRILELLRRRDDTLVVVGALHLIGEQGLVALLRRRGLQVEPLRPAAPAAAAHPHR
ncbi:MAG: TraB/GumN family protein [Cyanobium sp.]